MTKKRMMRLRPENMTKSELLKHVHSQERELRRLRPLADIGQRAIDMADDIDRYLHPDPRTDDEGRHD